MPFHHVAIAVRDTKATHEFYTQAMGFRLAKVVTGRSPTGGWSKHFFYDTGGDGLMAFWELHDDSLPEDYPTAISGGLGLPQWVNHFAFAAADREKLTEHRERWRKLGRDVVEINHGFCTSIYTEDPDGNLVEFCMDNRELDENDRREAEERLLDANPPIDADAEVEFFPKHP